MACILSTPGRLRPDEAERRSWAAWFDAVQDPATGWLLERDPTHHRLHSTAFALAAMAGRDRRLCRYRLGVHDVAATVGILAEAQSFLGADEVVGDTPLQLVLDRRPFI